MPPEAAQRNALREIYASELQRLGFKEDQAQRKAIDQLEKLRRELLARAGAAPSLGNRLLRTVAPGAYREPALQGVYLWGGVGRGKTWLMDLFCHSLPAGVARRHHFHRFMIEVHAALKKHRNVADPLIAVADGLAKSCRVICLDELFVSDIADAMLLGGLFKHLLGSGVTLVFTSNTPPKGLYRDGLQRQRFLPAIALLEKHTQVIAVDGDVDYRLRQLQQSATYLDSSDPRTEQQLAALFEDLADGPGDTGGSISINGRRIAVLRESENVVWFDFRAICEGPRSQNDYVQIAREYQSVIVSGIPALGENRDNAVRRLIALVDEFYDRAVKLIVSAAAPAEQLYRGERLRFEFQRTTSRLVEMRSDAYLAREHRA